MTRSRSKYRRLMRLSAASIITIGVALPVFFGATDASADVANVPSSAFYLDLGASESVGFQPTPTRPDGRPTSNGYANDLVAYEASRGVTLQMTQLGCPGESTASMISGGDSCYRNLTSQLAQAVSFLQAHYNDAGIVSIDLGFNNVAVCIRNHQVEASCVSSQLAAVAQDMPMILAALKGAAGPQVTFVGLGHYDPFLASTFQGPLGSQFATASADVINRLNGVLRNAYAAASISMAKVGTVFDSHEIGLVKLAGMGRVQENVARVCELTWMCKAAPYGPNIHLDERGYDAIAKAIESALPAPW